MATRAIQGNEKADSLSANGGSCFDFTLSPLNGTACVVIEHCPACKTRSGRLQILFFLSSYFFKSTLRFDGSIWLAVMTPKFLFINDFSQRQAASISLVRLFCEPDRQQTNDFGACGQAKFFFDSLF